MSPDASASIIAGAFSVALVLLGWRLNRKVDAVHEQTVNTHTTNLRADLDLVIAGQDRQDATARLMVQEIQGLSRRTAQVSLHIESLQSQFDTLAARLDAHVDDSEKSRRPRT